MSTFGFFGAVAATTVISTGIAVTTFAAMNDGFENPSTAAIVASALAGTATCATVAACCFCYVLNETAKRITPLVETGALLANAGLTEFEQRYS